MSESPAPRHSTGRRRRYATVGALGLVLSVLSVLTACTDDDAQEPAAGATRTTAPSTTLTTSPSDSMRDGGRVTELRLVREPVAPRTVVTHVWGRWPDRDRATRTVRLQRQAGRAVHAWIDQGFVSADYPTRDFAGAFATFTGGAAAQAGRQAWLTTNQVLGTRLLDVVPVRRTVRLVAFAPRGAAVGATAEVTLVMLGLEESGRRRETVVTGTLSLTRGPGGRWQVFGYDLRRSTGASGSYAAAQRDDPRGDQRDDPRGDQRGDPRRDRRDDRRDDRRGRNGQGR